MTDRYQQFLGTDPGMIVELIDDSVSPYRVRTEDGFEFCISADDFRDYYRKEGSSTPQRWAHLVTDLDQGMVNSGKVAEVMKVLHSFEEVFEDFDTSRGFVRAALRALGNDPKPDFKKAQQQLETLGWTTEGLTDRHWSRLLGVNGDTKALLMSEHCAVLQFPALPDLPGSAVESKRQAPPQSGPAAKKTPRKIAAEGRMARLKNVDMAVQGDNLTVTVDLSKEFGPSKSGKTIIVASTEGNKTVPGRVERIGLNIYREQDKKGKKGRHQSFKNVEMALQEDRLVIAVDLSKELGPSKSGKTIIIASTGGNQLVFGRPEKIGLNVYRKIE